MIENANNNCGVGRYYLEQWRNGTLIDRKEIKNTTMMVGRNLMLNVMFKSVSAVATWYFGLINNSGFTAISTADTMASHAGWAEFTAYSESTRQAWAPNSPSSGGIANTTLSTFTANATGAIYGAFLTSISTKSGATGTLWSAAAFTNGTLSVVNGDTINITYSYTLN